MKDSIIAKRDGKFILIDELKDNEFGSNCNCVCCICEKPLIAVRGEKQKSHFRHKSQEEHCRYEGNNLLREYVWELINLNEIVKKFNLTLDELYFVQLKQKMNKNLEKTVTEKKPSIKISKSVVYNDGLRILIDDKEYIIRMYFRKDDLTNLDKNTIKLNLNEILSKDKDPELIMNTIVELVTDKHKTIINQEIKKENTLIENKIMNKKILEQEHSNYIVNNKSNLYGKSNSNLDHNSRLKIKSITYTKLEKLDAPCPVCKQKELYRIKLSNGKSLLCDNCGFKP